MSCKTKNCGCIDTGLKTPSPCPHDIPNCPNANPCAETFSDCCIIHNGDTILDSQITQGMPLCEALQILTLMITNPGCVAVGATCQSVIGLHSIAITATTIKVGWTPLIATSYEVYYKPSSSSTWLINPTIPATQLFDTVGLLTPNTLYDIKVGSKCGQGPDCFSVTIQVLTKTS